MLKIVNEKKIGSPQTQTSSGRKNWANKISQKVFNKNANKAFKLFLTTIKKAKKSSSIVATKTIVKSNSHRNEAEKKLKTTLENNQEADANLQNKVMQNWM